MKVIVSPLVIAKLTYWQTLAGRDEISVIAHTKIKDGDVLIPDVFFPEQEGGAASNEFTVEAYHKIITEAFERYNIPPNELRGYIHTHPGFGHHPSATDEGTAKEIMGKYDYYITGIWDGKDFSFYVNIGKPVRLRTEVDYEIDYTILIESQKEELERQFKRFKVRKPQIGFKVGKKQIGGYGYGYGTYMQQKTKEEDFWDDGWDDDDDWDEISAYEKYVTNFKYWEIDEVAKELTNAFLKAGKGKVKCREHVIFSDNWKANPQAKNWYDKFGFTHNDLESYAVLLLSKDKEKIIEKLEGDIRFRRIDTLLYNLSDEAGNTDFYEVAKKIGKNKPFPVTEVRDDTRVGLG